MAKHWIRERIPTRLTGLLASAAMVAAVSGLVALVDPRVPPPYLLVAYVLVVVVVAIAWGTVMAAIAAVLSVGIFNYLFVEPVFSFHLEDPSNFVGSGAFLATAVVVGRLAGKSQRAALESARLMQEQSALRRIATLVARSAPSSTVVEAVTQEVGLLCDADLARMERYEDDGTVTGVAAWSRVPVRLTVGTRFDLVGPSIARDVREAGGPVRVASFVDAKGAIAREALRLGIHSSVGCPITVAGRLWGVIAASKKSGEPFPVNTEAQIGSFTELVGTAIANAQSRADLAASRARVVTAADETRRRLERNLHDGAQQRLVSLALKLRLAHDTLPAELPAVRAGLEAAAGELTNVLEELREISRGLHPAILSEGGLGPALRTLARRSVVPVEVHIEAGSRYLATLEVAVYYAVAEALTNTARHAAASQAEVAVERNGDTLLVTVSDDGVGGADPMRGSGLLGLRDRIEALGGSIEVISPIGRGTTIRVSLPVERKDSESTALGR